MTFKNTYFRIKYLKEQTIVLNLLFYYSYNCLLGIDAVVSLAAAPLFTDRWKLDAVVGGSQKAIGCVPGMALVTFSSLAK